MIRIMPQLRPVATSALFLLVGMVSTTTAGKGYTSPQSISGVQTSQTGTELLKHIGERLSGILRETDIISWSGTDTPGHKLLPVDTRTEYRATLARLGGDEFGMLLPTLEHERQAISVARRIIEGLDAEYTINDQKLSLRYCIGISIYPDHGEREQKLIRNADRAMFAARQHSGKYCIYSAKTL